MPRLEKWGDNVSRQPTAKTDRVTELPPAAIAAELATIPGWTGKDRRTAIQRTYTLPSFRAALAFVQFAGEVAESLDHHPNIDIRYHKVTLTLSTHSVGGKLTEKDFAFARALEGR